eukprot:gene5150-6410_t
MEELGLPPTKVVASTTTTTSTKQHHHHHHHHHHLSEQDLYTKMKNLESKLDFYNIQEEYIKYEYKNLKRELLHAQEEVKRIRSVPLLIGQLLEMVDTNTGIVQSTSGSTLCVRILSTIDRELLKPSASVALQRHSNALVDTLPPESDSSIHLLGANEKPSESYSDIGGSDIQKQEMREAVELPLTHHNLYKQIGIDPPRGVLLYGPPGTGKTMLAKAVAHHTSAAFIRVVGSEFVQKYLGEGPRLVRDVFRLARENAPAIIFIDEIDAIATKRFDAQTGADREVQRILMELLNQMDGFDVSVNVKVIMATNRQDTLDPALLRPGRLDRKIEFPLPDRRQKRLIFQVITSKMNLSDEVDLEDFVSRPDKLSGAEIQSICQEAGMHAIRKNRYVILAKDFEKDCITQPCNFNNASNWIGGSVPRINDTAIIDYSTVTTSNSSVNTIVSNHNINIQALNVVGPNVVIKILKGTALFAHKNITITLGSLIQTIGSKVTTQQLNFVNGGAYNNVGGQLSVTGRATFDNSTAFQSSEGAFINLQGFNVFNNQPLIKGGETLFNVLGTSVFYRGFLVQSTIAIGNAFIYGNAVATEITATHNLTLVSGSNVQVVNFDGSPGSVVRLENNSSMEITGVPKHYSVANINQLITVPNSIVTISNAKINITQYVSTGTVILDQVTGQLGNGILNTLYLAGDILLEATGSRINNLGNIASKYGTFDSYRISFDQLTGNRICNTTIQDELFQNLTITVLSTGKLYMEPLNCNFATTNQSTIDVFGQFVSIDAILYPQIKSYVSKSCHLQFIDTIVHHSINMSGGFLVADNLTIMEDLYIYNSAVVETNSTQSGSNPISVGGNIYLDEGSISVKNLSEKTTVPIYSDGTIDMTGQTLYIQFDDTIINSYQYNIFESKTNITSALFKQVKQRLMANES